MTLDQNIIQLIGKSPTPALAEGYLTLIQDISAILANDWYNTPSEEIKRLINLAIAASLKIVI